MTSELMANVASEIIEYQESLVQRDVFPEFEPTLSGVSVPELGLVWPAVTAYVIGYRHSRVMFVPGELDGEMLCASEYAQVPVSAGVALKRGIKMVQAVTACERCKYQSFAWARQAKLKSPPCTLSVALLVVVVVGDHYYLGIMRGKRTSIPALRKMLTAARAHNEAWRSIPFIVASLRNEMGKGPNPKVWWTWDVRVDQEGLAQVDLVGPPPWAEWFSGEQVHSALARLYRPYYDRSDEVVDESAFDNAATDDDDLPF